MKNIGLINLSLGKVDEKMPDGQHVFRKVAEFLYTYTRLLV